MPKRTFKGSKVKRRRVGFMARMASISGQDVIKRRRNKGRKKVAHK